MKRGFLLREWAVVVILTMTAAGYVAAEEKQNPVKEEIFAQEVTFDAQTGEIRYVMPEAALVRIRIGIKNGGPLLRVLLDWDKREAGPHTDVWDFKDDTGRVDFGRGNDYLVTLSCIPADPAEWEHYHSTIKGFRQAPKFSISFPESAVVDNTVMFNNMDPVRVSIDKDDAKWLTETKYEVGFFLNSLFLTEDEEGINPFTYRLNTTGLREGVHAITVNVVGYEGEVGTKSVQVKILK